MLCMNDILYFIEDFGTLFSSCTKRAWALEKHHERLNKITKAHHHRSHHNQSNTSLSLSLSLSLRESLSLYSALYHLFPKVVFTQLDPADCCNRFFSESISHSHKPLP
ncbi:hypothetical protein L6452_16263 [Arctium lappa]|uniref:Uncharacterized protein n=1 Tax=Arctium lappa TaxID=4217 RepID=A0ACB9C098_ARCLA|nr:hypothetical protein L6452_16263 [Arctium lappa]